MSLALSPTATAPLPAGSCPHLGAVVRRVLVSIGVACAAPAALFYTVMVLSGVWVAIGAALCWQYGALALRAWTGRRTSGLLVLMAAVLTGRTVVSLAAHSTFLYFLQPIVTDCLVATAFLGSLFLARPMAARLAGDFYPMTDEVAGRPAVRRLFTLLTALWALLYLGKASLTLWLLTSQSVQTFVLVKSLSVLAINLSAAAATVGLCVLVGRREGLLART